MTLRSRAVGVIPPCVLRYATKGRRRLARLERTLYTGGEPIVHYGPFAGMKLINEYGPGYWPRVIGSYESELHDTISEILEREYETVVNIGCADGYYAIGFALKMRQARVFAFDIDEQAQARCREAAAINGVSSRVTVLGECDWIGLEDACAGRTLVLCDCEGCEFDLLDPLRVPALAHADLLVELHDLYNPAISSTIGARFHSTHASSIVDSRPCDPTVDRYEILRDLRLEDRRIALNDERGGDVYAQMQWAFLRAGEDRR